MLHLKETQTSSWYVTLTVNCISGCLVDLRNTSGYCFTLGSGIFSWKSKKQQTVAQSIAEADFVAATTAVNQALWLRIFLLDLNLEQKERTEIFVDNQTAIVISHDPVFHGTTKHFNIELFFVREVQKEKVVTLIYCKSEDQLADLFTKPFQISRFEFLRQKIGVCSS